MIQNWRGRRQITLWSSWKGFTFIPRVIGSHCVVLLRIVITFYKKESDCIVWVWLCVCVPVPIDYYFTHCLRGPWYMATHYQEWPLSTFNNVSIMLLYEMSTFVPPVKGGKYGNKKIGRWCTWLNNLFPPLFLLKW